MRLTRPTCSAAILAACSSTFIVLIENRLFWSAFFRVLDPGTAHGFLVTAAAFVILTGTLTALFLLFSYTFLFRSVLITMLVLSSVIGYFGSAYGVVIDGSMVQNIVATDRREAVELLTIPFVAHVALYGVLPALTVGLVRVRSLATRRDLWLRTVTFGVTLVSVLAAAILISKDLALIGREHKELRLSINPLYPVYAAVKYARKTSGPAVAVTPIGADARQVDAGPRRRRTVIVLVVGETARGKEFSLNGYGRSTNPFLEKDGVVSFTQAYACGTSTAESLPCMFSHFHRADYSPAKAVRHENALDVLSRAGVNVLWRDNNSGCKGVCARVATEDLSHASVTGLCNGQECLDEVLLDRLEERIDRSRADTLIVLHQKGSHGPAYFRRHPSSFSVFLPECISDAPQDCAGDEIVNAYDNSILYTDYFLHRTIDLLRKRSATDDVVMVYFSDHGESLGERGLYLHGLPYFIAPDEQTHVPFIVWMSDGYAGDNGVDRDCLRANRSLPYSHANIFHSLLGAFRVRTSVYDRDYDVFAQCRAPGALFARSDIYAVGPGQ
jgi:lipid A ethanolaminephosphotransferase